VATQTATDIDGAVRAAETLGFPVALKIFSPATSHKSEIGGVILDLHTSEEVRTAARTLASRLTATHPKAQLTGYTVQPMVQRRAALELIAGLACDPVFGSIVLFGAGGTDTEIIRDHAVSLAPLNRALARELIDRTRIARRLQSHSGAPPADRAAVEHVLVKLSQLQVDFPQIEELDINPLLADHAGVLALDARIRISTDA
jgi:acetyltransferase